ncbi:MAG: chemotaxis protein [Burkholderiales bacterium]
MHEHTQYSLSGDSSRVNLAGSNRIELLLFSLGTPELFGINVFKVREAFQTPTITRSPNMPYAVEGVISLRGNIIPVVSLAKAIGLKEAPQKPGGTMVVAEFCNRTQGFLVHEVDRIVRLEWERVKAPQSLMESMHGLITSIAELPDGKLVSILDVEQILVNTVGETPLSGIEPASRIRERCIVFADDSAIARKQIVGVLDKLGIKYQQAADGSEAWDKLQAMANRAQAENRPLGQSIHLILTDAEMPEMDGYVLTKNIKADDRFRGIPVVMHSSLSSIASRAAGQSVGVDAYVAKFDPDTLVSTLSALLSREADSATAAAA